MKQSFNIASHDLKHDSLLQNDGRIVVMATIYQSITRQTGVPCRVQTFKSDIDLSTKKSDVLLTMK